MPLGDPAYDYLERLADLGYAPGYSRSMRPISIAYAVELVRQAERLAAARGVPEPPFLGTLRDLVERLRAHAFRGGHFGGEAGVAATGRDEVLTKIPNSWAEQAGQFPRPAGVGLLTGSGTAFGLTARVDAARLVAGEVALGAGFGANGAAFELRRGYVKVGYRAIEIQAGRDDIAWAESPFASMLLSGNAPAFDHVTLRTARPVRLPWVLRWLGEWQTMLFFGRLDQELPHRDPWIVGHRIGLLVLPWLELGGAHVFAFGGAGAPRMSAARVVGEFFGNRPDMYSANYANHGLSWDLRVRVKSWFEVYGEHYLEDCCSNLLGQDSSVQVGVRRARVISSKDDLALEFVHTTHIAYLGDADKTPEWLHGGRFLGNPLGARGYGGYLLWRFLGDGGAAVKLRLGLEARDDRRDVGGPREWRYGGVLEGRLPLLRGRAGRVEARGRVGLERVLSAGHLAGDDRTGGLVELAIEASL